MTTASYIPIAIADDHVMMRNAISNMISTFPGFKVVLEADNGEQLIEGLLKARQLPEICILDIQMPVMNGYDTVIQLKKRWPTIKILALTMYNHEFSTIKMLKNGANGYLLKGADLNELHKALEELHTKGYYSSDFVASNFFQLLQSENENPLYKISERELQFLKYCCTEMNYKEIGKAMGVSSRTAEGYRDALFDKLSIHTRAGLVMFAINTGMVQLNEEPDKI